MNIEKFLTPEAIWLDLEESDKNALLTRMAGNLADRYGLAGAAAVGEAILCREAQMSTGIGYGIAIPHCRLESVARVGMIVGRVRRGVEFAAIDDVPVRIIFMLAAPKKPSEEYTRLLGTISKIMAVADTRAKLLTAGTSQQFLQVLIAGERQFQPKPAHVG